jgi:mono/diheme cytochrome c family protein
VALLVIGCQPGLNRQPKIPKPDSVCTFFADGQSNRPPVPGTVSRDDMYEKFALFTGKSENRYVTDFPVDVTEALLQRGRERFNIFCAQCHDRTGSGNGKVVARGYIKPPNYSTDESRGLKLRGQDVKLTEAPVGYFFEVISEGFGAMPSLGDMIPVEDRWAIVAYVRALQLTEGGGDGR